MEMTDNIFEIDTIALAHVACAQRESGILLTVFAAAYLSVNHSWIFHVLERTELLELKSRFFRRIYYDSTTHVEFEGMTRGQFFMARGLSCERLLVCDGFRSHLPLEPGRNHSKELCWTRLPTAGSVRVC